MKKTNHIILFPGCFDPFHQGHIHVIKCLLTKFKKNKIILVPTANPPHKPAPFFSKEKRLEIIKNTIKKEKLTKKVTIKLQEYQQQKSYTYQTVKHYKKFAKKIYLTLGSDNISKLSTFKEYQSIIENCTIILIKREIESVKKINLIINQKFPAQKEKFIIVEIPPQKIESSTIKTTLLNTISLKKWQKNYQIKTKIPSIIGLTGQIGAGKSTAAKIIKENNPITLIDLDKIGHHCLKDNTIKENLISQFGSTIVTTKNNISRKKLGKIAFKNQSNLKKLNSIIHPEIKKETLKKIIHSKQPCLICGALLNEIKLLSLCDHVITIIPNKMNQKENKKLNRKEFQKSIDSYKKMASYLITNNFDKSFKQNCLNTFKKIPPPNNNIK